MRCGRAVFVEPEASIAGVRQAVLAARARGEAARAYRIIFEWAHYPGKLQNALPDLGAHLGPSRWLLEGSDGGGLRCALLTDAAAGDGVILHFESGRPFVTYYPLERLEGD